MPVFEIALEDGRKLRIDADDQQAALAGVEHFVKNDAPVKEPQAKTAGGSDALSAIGRTAKQFPLGIVRGFRGLADIGAADLEVMNQTDRPAPRPEDYDPGLNKIVGGENLPQNRAEKIASAAGAAVPAMLGMGPPTPASLAAGALSGTGGEIGRQLAEGTPYEKPAEFAGALIAPNAGNLARLSAPALAKAASSIGEGAKAVATSPYTASVAMDLLGGHGLATAGTMLAKKLLAEKAIKRLLGGAEEAAPAVERSGPTGPRINPTEPTSGPWGDIPPPAESEGLAIPPKGFESELNKDVRSLNQASKRDAREQKAQGQQTVMEAMPLIRGLAKMEKLKAAERDTAASNTQDLLNRVFSANAETAPAAETAAPQTGLVPMPRAQRPQPVTPDVINAGDLSAQPMLPPPGGPIQQPGPAPQLALPKPQTIYSGDVPPELLRLMPPNYRALAQLQPGIQPRRPGPPGVIPMGGPAEQRLLPPPQPRAMPPQEQPPGTINLGPPADMPTPRALTPIEELEARVKPSMQSRRVRGEMAQEEAEDPVAQAQRAMAAVQARRALARAQAQQPPAAAAPAPAPAAPPMPAPAAPAPVGDGLEIPDFLRRTMPQQAPAAPQPPVPAPPKVITKKVTQKSAQPTVTEAPVAAPKVAQDPELKKLLAASLVKERAARDARLASQSSDLTIPDFLKRTADNKLPEAPVQAPVVTLAPRLKLYEAMGRAARQQDTPNVPAVRPVDAPVVTATKALAKANGKTTPATTTADVPNVDLSPHYAKSPKLEDVITSSKEDFLRGKAVDAAWVPKSLETISRVIGEKYKTAQALAKEIPSFDMHDFLSRYVHSRSFAEGDIIRDALKAKYPDASSAIDARLNGDAFKAIYPKKSKGAAKYNGRD